MATPEDDYNTPSFTTTKPWSEFFSTSHLSLPVSFSDLTTRVKLNLTYFKLNYLHLTLTIFFISLLFRPLSLFILFITAAAWHFVYLTRLPDASVEVAGITISENIVVAVLGVVTVVALLFANVWMNLFVSVAVSVVVVFLHAAVRDSRFGDDNPYGGLLDDDVSGGYTEF